MIWHKRSSSAYIKYLRKKGIHIGEHCIIRAPRTARIDVSRPSLVTIEQCGYEYELSNIDA